MAKSTTNKIKSEKIKVESAYSQANLAGVSKPRNWALIVSWIAAGISLAGMIGTWIFLGYKFGQVEQEFRDAIKQHETRISEIKEDQKDLKQETKDISIQLSVIKTHLEYIREKQSKKST